LSTRGFRSLELLAQLLGAVAAPPALDLGLGHDLGQRDQIAFAQRPQLEAFAAKLSQLHLSSSS
jgi:hypothetical protein